MTSKKQTTAQKAAAKKNAAKSRNAKKKNPKKLTAAQKAEKAKKKAEKEKRKKQAKQRAANKKRIRNAPKYEIWITYNAELKKIKLPVNPEQFNVKIGSNNQSVDIVGLGEITIMQSRPAIRFSFKSFFPKSTFPGVQVKTLSKPTDLVEKIKKWKASKRPVHFIITGKQGVNIYCTIERFDYEEDGGDPGTLQYSIELKEYREVKIRKVKTKKTTKKKTTKGKKKATVKKANSRTSNKVTPKTYTVVKGDSLWKIAQKFYGNGSQYTKIYDANKSTIGGNPNLIYPGQTFTIPD